MVGIRDADQPEDSGPDATSPEHEITLRIVRQPLDGHEAAFERALAETLEAACRVPGYRGSRVLAPSKGFPGYTVLIRFDGRDSLHAWTASEARDHRLAQLDAVSAGTGGVFNITGTAQERPLAIALTPLDQFVRTSVSGIGLLLLGTALALILANTPLADSYERFWTTTLAITADGGGVAETLRRWVNDGLLALFFFVIGLEIKREVLVGEMQHAPLAWLAVAAAFGGAAIPALVYVGINALWAGEPSGWGVPVGTDTAFAVSLLTLFKGRVPPSLIAFIVAFSIVDDLFAVLIIAFFYTSTINWYAAGIALVLLIALGAANYAGAQRWPVYAFLGLGVWIAVFESGIHATLAGVLVALTIPAHAWINPSEFIARGEALLDEFTDVQEPGATTLSHEELARAAQRMEDLVRDVETPMNHMNHALTPWVDYGVLPLFAFANAGIVLFEGLGAALASPIAWGVIFGLLVGKPLGVTLLAWLAVRLGPAELPAGVTWHHIVGVGFIGGIGFTMSLFIASLAFPSGPESHAARIGMLIGSFVAGVVAYLYLDRTLPGKG